MPFTCTKNFQKTSKKHQDVVMVSVDVSVAVVGATGVVESQDVVVVSVVSVVVVEIAGVDEVVGQSKCGTT